MKPDLAGQDRVAGTTYGAASSCGSADGFAGTSAAAPHVAGAAALVRSWRPAYTAAQLRSYLTAHALDLGAPGTDSTFGAGLLALPDLGTRVTVQTLPNPSAIDEAITVTATLAPADATGSVTFRDVTGGGSVDLGTAPVAAGSASISATFGTAGQRLLVADYSGDGVHAPTASAPFTHAVTATGLIATATTVALAPNPVGTGSIATFTATVAPNPASGSMTWIIDGVEAETTPVGAGGTAKVTRTFWAPGTHTVRAAFAEGTTFEGSTSPEQTLTVQPGTIVTVGASRSKAVSGETLVKLSARIADPDATGTVTFRDTIGSTSTTLGTVSLATGADADLTAALSVRLKGAGTHRVTAIYGGNGTYAPATSPSVVVTVTADVGVSATGIGVQYPTFYPFKDGYRDTVALRGTPGEPLSVSIKVYSNRGKLIRSWSLASRTSPWAVAWNGRTASGAKVPAGRYKVVQRLRDAVGHVRSITAFTTVSGKRLYWASGSQIKYADTGAFGASGSAGAYRSDVFARGVYLDGGDCEYDWDLGEEICSLAYGRHRFVLPAAASYGSIRVSVYARSWAGPGHVAIEDYASGELDVARSLGRSTAWYSSSAVGSSGHVNASRVVTAYVWASAEDNGAVDYWRVRLLYRYARLK